MWFQDRRLSAQARPVPRRDPPPEQRSARQSIGESASRRRGEPSGDDRQPRRKTAPCWRTGKSSGPDRSPARGTTRFARTPIDSDEDAGPASLLQYARPPHRHGSPQGPQSSHSHPPPHRVRQSLSPRSGLGTHDRDLRRWPAQAGSDRWLRTTSPRQTAPPVFVRERSVEVDVDPVVADRVGQHPRSRAGRRGNAKTAVEQPIVESL